MYRPRNPRKGRQLFVDTIALISSPDRSNGLSSSENVAETRF